MARLTYRERKALPRSAFAIPERRAYPIHDRAHARNALARVSQFGTPEEKRMVRLAVARRFPDVLGEKTAEYVRRTGRKVAYR